MYIRASETFVKILKLSPSAAMTSAAAAGMSTAKITFAATAGLSLYFGSSRRFPDKLLQII